ncbi:MAG TPA: helix-turn-helix domain-containing protein, partial [Eoetvoesiella sp.]
MPDSRIQKYSANPPVEKNDAMSDAIVTGSAANGRSSVSRILDILDLFTPETTIVQVDEVGAQLGVGRSTCYRYLQELCDSGLLVQQGKGRYGLGPRVIELERLLQLSDPLLNAGKTIMAELAPICENRTLLLCSLFKDRVLCIHQTGPDHIIHANEKMPIYRGRGSTLPLFQGAGSQAILAHLAPHQVQALYLAKQSEIAAAGLGSDWKEFRATLNVIRKQGFVSTVGKRNPRVLALAV